MTRKQQAVPGSVKGFAPKWSERAFTVPRRVGLSRNPGVFRYDVGLDMTFYRHELLKIPRTVDRSVPTGTVAGRGIRIDEDANWDEKSETD